MTNSLWYAADQSARMAVSVDADINLAIVSPEQINHLKALVLESVSNRESKRIYGRGD